MTFLLGLSILVFVADQLSLILICTTLMVFRPRVHRTFRTVNGHGFAVTGRSIGSGLVSVMSSTTRVLSGHGRNTLVIVRQGSRLLRFTGAKAALRSPVILRLLASVF